MKKERLRALVDTLGAKYSEILGIDLLKRNDKEIFKWFLASLLFGAPITEYSVIKTYKCFQKYDVLTSKQILSTGWGGLVKILDEGGYTRYDFKTADKLLHVMKNLTEDYGGSMVLIHRRSSGSLDLEERLKSLGKGIGDVTVSIFLRELRGIWQKADPRPTPLVVEAAKHLGILGKDTDAETASVRLKCFWKENEIKGKSFVNFETALLRMCKDYLRKRKISPFT